MTVADPIVADSVGSLAVGLVPRAPCLFRLDSARSLHAALLRRLERPDPSLSAALHDAPDGAHTVARPWTVSIRGRVGRIRWRCEGGPEELLRQVNALAEYAFYCGTGIKTALGMGQTVVISGRRGSS